VSEPVDIAEYDAVIVGSAVRMRRWQRAAMGFLLKNRQELQSKRVAYFSVSLAQAHESVASQAEARRYREYPTQHFPELKPVATASFVGALDFSVLSASEAVYVQAFGVKEGDYRDWEAIQDWALQAAEALGVLEPVLA
jgi:menaquinone-dependent protoporphyrinogen oxidase